MAYHICSSCARDTAQSAKSIVTETRPITVDQSMGWHPLHSTGLAIPHKGGLGNNGKFHICVFGCGDYVFEK